MAGSIGVAEAPHIHDDVEHRDTVARALGVLSDQERDAIALRFGAELTVPEISKLLEEPLTTREGSTGRCESSVRSSSRPRRERHPYDGPRAHEDPLLAGGARDLACPAGRAGAVLRVA
ncbi:MAG: hypothetical protein H0U32_11715 [Thermoleophilaceae bacterium]|nr:hypothetical protein [Thermoleophilaceae bacterium]